jgi:hypothetical protein
MVIRRRIENLEKMANSDSIRSFEEMMRECCKLMNAISRGVRLDSIGVKRFHPAMKAGLAKAIPDMEQSMREAQETLPLEVTAQLILVYRDPDARALLTPTLLELVEGVLKLERDGKLTVGA